jgi:lipid II:glycine glycyltransferase (peptidoglycan interpeptide bridge formation enzyme)
MNAIKTLGVKNGAIFVKMEPNVLSVVPTPEVGEEFSTSPEKASGSFALQNGAQDNKGYNLVLSKPTLPKYSFLVDLTPPVNEVLGRMHEKTRYNIKLAEKHDVKVERRNDIEAVKIFFNLVTQTEKRQGFLQLNHPLSYYEKIFELFNPLGQCFVLVATYEGQPLSAVFLLKFKDTLYYPYGGWSSEHRELMPNNLIHFEAIKLGKELGCKTYDMWGAYKEKDSPGDLWYGVYRFKQGFGGRFVTYAGPYDLVVKPTFYKITNTLYDWRKFLLKLTGRGL